ncbi:nitrate reductase [Jejubacter calystegiae]|uniref:Nitrate reductase n=1 Tax=Jejubacter calystegiae TaxID=2579935 RepID=A0A4P8YPH1_9ENTR|nr:nitrate reductase [Jejubacter calystegiae]QCT22759.1 nitrate reductase [Jejubacter calystegiae]
MSAVRTTCPYCGVGCGLVAERDDKGTLRLRGDPDHPASFGRLCVKGAALGETLGLSGRLLYPQVNGQRQTWSQALDYAAGQMKAIIEQYGPRAVAFYASGQLLTEDYYVANKLMKGFIGSANIDTNSRLCMSSAVVGYKRAFGADAVPGCYQDLEQTDLLLVTGSNAAWAHPVLWQRVLEAKRRRPQMKIVVIDPRRTATCDGADLHLALRPGSDGALFNGLLREVVRRKPLAAVRFAGQEQALAAAEPWHLAACADFCQLPQAQLRQLIDWLCAADSMITLWTMGINQSTSGSDKSNAIINLHLASGHYGRPGCGPFSLTGQPNAMGGREVGGLASQLACHMDFVPEDIARLRRFWGSERIAQTPGLNAVALFDAIARGEVKAVWIMGTNPAVSLPDSLRVNQALACCPLVIVSEVAAQTDTSRYAHVRFPALAWGEKNGTVTNSERRISRQRPFLPAPGEARADWWIVAQIARRLGYGDAFAWQHPQQIFCEHAALSGFENQGQRAFDISALAGLSQQQYDQLKPVQWPVTAQHPQGTDRLLIEREGWRKDGRAALVAVEPQLPRAVVGRHYPLLLNTGRLRDQWHTMTRTGAVPRLMAHTPQPQLAIAPADARRYGLRQGGLARVVSPQGWIAVRVRVSDEQLAGSLFLPMHWTDSFAGQGRVNALVSAACCPHSGQPESKQTAVRVEPWRPRWQGELLCREAPTFDSQIQWWRRPVEGCDHYHLAGEGDPEGWIRAQCQQRGWLIQHAAGPGFVHLLAWQGERLMLAFYSAERLPEVDIPWVASAFCGDASQCHALLAGQAPQGEGGEGRLICSCFGVGERAIAAAIAGGCVTTEALGQRLRCGTNCGSCLPELRHCLKSAG